MKIPKFSFPSGAAPEPDPPGVTVPAWLVRAAKFASWVAMAVLVYFLWLYTLDIARDRAGELHLTRAGTWAGDLSFWFPYIVGFAILSFGIPYVAKIAIPTFMSLSWRGAFWPKLWALFIALAVSLVVIAGTFSVQGHSIMERDRDAAVATEQVQLGRATLEARIADVQHQMNERSRSESVYVRTAASMSPEAYDRFVESRRGDWQYDRLRSYRAVSEEMVRLNQEMSALRQQQAQQTAVAAVQREVTTERTDWIADVLGWLEGVRAILLSLVMDVVCLLMPWIALRLEHARNAQMGRVVDERPIDPAHTLEDLRDEPAMRFRAPRSEAELGKKERMIDAETGDELVDVRPHRRRVKRQGKTQTFAEVTLAPEFVPPDERGAQMASDERVARSVANRAENTEQDGGDTQAHNEGDSTKTDTGAPADTQGDNVVVESHSDTLLTDEELAALAAEEPDEPIAEGRSDDGEQAAAGEADQEQVHVTALPDGEGVAQGEPYGPPAERRPERLLEAAE